MSTSVPDNEVFHHEKLDEGREMWFLPNWGIILKGTRGYYASNDLRYDLIGKIQNHKLKQPTLGPYNSWEKAYLKYNAKLQQHPQDDGQKSVEWKPKAFDAQDAIIKKLDHRLQSLGVQPEIWGSLEAIELQMLQLLEIRYIAQHPRAVTGKEKCIQHQWVQYLQEHYPQALPGTLASYLSHRVFGHLTKERAESDFIKAIRDFIQEINPEMS